MAWRNFEALRRIFTYKWYWFIEEARRGFFIDRVCSLVTALFHPSCILDRQERNG